MANHIIQLTTSLYYIFVNLKQLRVIVRVMVGLRKVAQIKLF